MAVGDRKVRKPRIRKTAPTVREKVEAAREKASQEKPRKSRRLALRTFSKTTAPLRRLHFPDNKLFAWLRPVGRVFKKALSFLVPKYFINSWREVRQVVWPSRRETWRLTLAVFIFAVVFGAMVAGVDKGLDEIFKKVILK